MVPACSHLELVAFGFMVEFSLAVSFTNKPFGIVYGVLRILLLLSEGFIPDQHRITATKKHARSGGLTDH